MVLCVMQFIIGGWCLNQALTTAVLYQTWWCMGLLNFLVGVFSIGMGWATLQLEVRRQVLKEKLDYAQYLLDRIKTRSEPDVT